MNVKKILLLGIVATLTLGLGACKKSSDVVELKNGKDEKNIIIGVCPGPYGDMFKDAIQPSLEERGYKVTIKEFSDYVQPNKALAKKEIDVNMFQHSIYLKRFSEENNLELSAITEIPTAGMGIFSNKVKSLEEIKDGSLVTLPNDPTNLTRALKVLEAAGLIKIDTKADPALATEKDLSENSKNLKFKLIEAPQLPRTLDSADLAVVNGNYAIAAGLDLSEAVYSEKLKTGYINVIAVRTSDVEDKLSKDILKIVKSDKFKAIIDNSKGQYKSFQKPENY